MKLFELEPKVKMQELVNVLNRASDAYYNGREVLTDHEYDSLLEELQNLEKKYNIILPDSPTNNVGSPVKDSKLQKVKHEFPAKSLDKTKDKLIFAGVFGVNHNSTDKAVVMWKLDGCTLQLTYNHGRLQQAVTRGDGYIGQDVTHNAVKIAGIPITVTDDNKFTVRGEVVMSYEWFKTINSKLDDDKKFKNPRNLASATLTMLDSEEVKNRHLQFFMFELVDHPDMKSMNFYQRLLFGQQNCFSVVPFVYTSVWGIDGYGSIEDAIDEFDPTTFEYPVDGLVGAYNDTTFTDKLEGTEHHPHILRGYALKWKDEERESILRSIEWSPSRTGLLNPVAVFDSVELEGTTVSRASLHNYSIMEKMHLHIGDTVKVIKSNKIIPQIVENLSESPEYTDSTFYDEFKPKCPSCLTLGSLSISKDNVKSVYCMNSNCPAKLIYKFEHFCERTSMNIEGLSEATITKFVNLGYLKTFSDIYTLDRYSEEIKNLEGFGSKSWDNLWKSIQISRNTSLENLLSGIGISNIGNSQSRAISQYFNNDPNKFLDAKYLAFSTIKGIGPIVEVSILKWLHDERNVAEFEELLQHLQFSPEKPFNDLDVLEGKTFVITGSLHKYKNRGELESVIRKLGGNVSSSVSKKTSYLVNNDVNSTSSKNKKANELGIEIISEDQFIDMIS